MIARYGHSWRGIKPKVAAEHGAVGCIIYSDPRDDGYSAGERFPTAPCARTTACSAAACKTAPNSIGRSADSGYRRHARTPSASTSKTPRRSRKFPCCRFPTPTPQPLLAAINGPSRPPSLARRPAHHLSHRSRPRESSPESSFQLGYQAALRRDRENSRLAVSRRVGSSRQPSRRLGQRRRRSDLRPWLPSSKKPASLGELRESRMEAQAHHHLLRLGWRRARPARFHRMGRRPTPTNFARTRSPISIPTRNGRGFFGAEGSHTLEKFINDVARDVQDPETKLSVWKRWQLHDITQCKCDEASPGDRASAATCASEVSGGGSDHAGFQNFLGIAVLNLGFGGEDGERHLSLHLRRFLLVHAFQRHRFRLRPRAFAQVAGTAVMRLADADLLPFDFSDFADTVQTYVHGLQTFSTKRDEIRERNLEIEEGAFTASADPKKPYVPPAETGNVPPHLNFAPLQNGADALTRSAEEYKKLWRMRPKTAAHANFSVACRSRIACSSTASANSPTRKVSPESVVQAPDLRAGCLHRLRSQSDPGCSRSHGAKAVEAGRRSHRPRRRSAARRSNAGLFGSCQTLRRQVAQTLLSVSTSTFSSSQQVT